MIDHTTEVTSNDVYAVGDEHLGSPDSRVGCGPWGANDGDSAMIHLISDRVSEFDGGRRLGSSWLFAELSTLPGQHRRWNLNDRDSSKASDGTELVASMGWAPLSYGCVGIARSADVPGSRVVWSWLILIPWAVNDAKPWIDGTELLEGPWFPRRNSVPGYLPRCARFSTSGTARRWGKRAAEEFIRRFQEE